jgi:peptidyl-prolyl cis-trans isomerase B (cyclophilin B)
MHDNGTYLDGQYAAFGKVTSGIEIVDRIASVRTDYSDRPYEDQKIKTIRVD